MVTVHTSGGDTTWQEARYGKGDEGYTITTMCGEVFPLVPEKYVDLVQMANGISLSEDRGTYPFIDEETQLLIQSDSGCWGVMPQTVDTKEDPRKGRLMSCDGAFIQVILPGDELVTLRCYAFLPEWIESTVFVWPDNTYFLFRPEEVS